MFPPGPGKREVPVGIAYCPAKVTGSLVLQSDLRLWDDGAGRIRHRTRQSARNRLGIAECRHKAPKIKAPSNPRRKDLQALIPVCWDMMSPTLSSAKFSIEPLSDRRESSSYPERNTTTHG